MWKIVPSEPTPEMIAAARANMLRGSQAIYDALLREAPQPSDTLLAGYRVDWPGGLSGQLVTFIVPTESATLDRVRADGVATLTPVYYAPPSTNRDAEILDWIESCRAGARGYIELEIGDMSLRDAAIEELDRRDESQ